MYIASKLPKLARYLLKVSLLLYFSRKSVITSLLPYQIKYMTFLGKGRIHNEPDVTSNFTS